MMAVMAVMAWTRVWPGADLGVFSYARALWGNDSEREARSRQREVSVGSMLGQRFIYIGSDWFR